MLDSAWEEAKNILAIRLDNVGDVILCIPALKAIKESLPEARLSLLASPSGSRMAPMMSFVDEVLAERVVWQDVGGRMSLDPQRELRLVQTIKERGFDAAIIFTSFSQSPYPPAYVCYLAGIPLRLGQSKEFGGSLLTHEIKNPPDQLYQVERALRLIESVGFAVYDRNPTIIISRAALEAAKDRLRSRGIDPEKGYAIIHPGASCSSRTWSSERFALVGSLLQRHTSLPIVITGDDKDVSRAGVISEVVGRNSASLAGETTLEEFAALIKMARVVISNNTSAMHFAAATGTPLVVAFAGTDLESQWRPSGVPVKLMRRETPCSPCYLFECPTQHECLDLEPEEVVEAALELLSHATTQSR